MTMAKEKRYTISQAAEITGYKPHVLRFYEKEFNLEIPRNKSGHRYFTFKEIEIFEYIKQLQGKGLTNNQIKLILNSPEIIVEQNNQAKEIAVTQAVSSNMSSLEKQLEEHFAHFKEALREDLSGLSENIKELSNEVRAKDKDVLVCQNAKLKMDLKRKAYEVAELKEQLRRERNKKKSFLGKLFK